MPTFWCNVGKFKEVIQSHSNALLFTPRQLQVFPEMFLTGCLAIQPHLMTQWGKFRAKEMEACLGTQ